MKRASKRLVITKGLDIAREEGGGTEEGGVLITFICESLRVGAGQTLERRWREGVLGSAKH